MNASPTARARAEVAVRASGGGLLGNNPSLVELAADAIRRMILAGELRPGERLHEEHMTGILGISRPPLREAIQMLHQEGLVERMPRRGGRVAGEAALRAGHRPGFPRPPAGS